MSLFGGRDPLAVRAELLANGTKCGHLDENRDHDCDVIIQPTRDGKLVDGVLAHWRVVHPEGDGE